MRLISPDRLGTFVTTKADRDAYRTKGKPISNRKISQGELARSAGVHRSFISQLINGRRTSCTPLTAERICDRLDVEMSILFEVRRQDDITTRRVAA